jgi:hypothetical protein
MDSSPSRQETFLSLLLDRLCSMIVVLRSLTVFETTGSHSPLKPVLLLQIHTLFFSISIHSLHFLFVCTSYQCGSFLERRSGQPAAVRQNCLWTDTIQAGRARR